MKLLFIVVLSLACTATLARKYRRVDNDNANANANANAADNNKDGDKAAGAAADGAAAPSFGIGACINRFVCSLPTYEDGAAGGGAGANGAQDCFAGGNAWKKDQANCATLCANGGKGNNGKGNGDDDAKDAQKVNCDAPDCSNADTKTHYYCMTDCRVNAADEPEICKDVKCKADTEPEKAEDPADAAKTIDEWRCPGKDDTTARRRLKIRRKMQSRLGKFALKGNYKGMNMMLRRMAKMGEYHCKRTGFMKYLMYPIAIFKCIFHKMYCLFATCGDNTVTILDGPDCMDEANKEMEECKKPDCSVDANKEKAECKKGGATASAECWKGGKDVDDLTKCAANVCDQ